MESLIKYGMSYLLNWKFTERKAYYNSSSVIILSGLGNAVIKAYL